MPNRSVLEPAPEHPPAGELPCRTHDPDLWFAESPVDLEHAKALCRACPARTAWASSAWWPGSAGRPAGAVIVDFAVIVPFAALTWLWAIALGVVVWRRGARGPGTTCSAAPHR